MEEVTFSDGLIIFKVIVSEEKIIVAHDIASLCLIDYEGKIF